MLNMSQSSQIICSIVTATAFFLMMVIWGSVLLASLRGGDEKEAAGGVGFIVVAVFMLGDTLTTYHEMQESRASSYSAIKGYETMRSASMGSGVLIVVFFIGMMVANGNGDYRTLLTLRAILMGLICCLISFMSRSRLLWDRYMCNGAPHQQVEPCIMLQANQA